MSYQNESFEITVSRESLITLIALIWFLPSMSSHMSYKDIIFCESLITLVAVVWLISTVCSQISYKDIILCESLITLVAMEWFIFSPVCVLICNISLFFCVKTLSNWLHSYDFF